MGPKSDSEWVIARLALADDRPRQRRASYRALDPLWRALVRGRVQRAVAEAALATEHAGDEAHVHRWAYLSLRGHSPGVDTLAAVEAAFRAELAARPARGPARWLASGLALASIAVLLSWAAFVRFAPDHWRDPTLLPVSARAFAEGGRPDPGGAAARALFSDAIPAFLVALDAARGDVEGERVAQLAAAERRVLAETESVLGADAASFLRAVCNQARELAGGQDSPAVDGFLRSVDAFNEAIERRGLGYYLDAEVLSQSGTLRVYLASFAVEQVRWFEAAGSKVRTLQLARRDKLNFVRGVLGMTRPHIRDALVMRERVEAWIVSALLPALAPDGRLALRDAGVGGPVLANLSRLELRAADAARSALRQLVPGCSALTDTGALFARRKAVFELMRQRTARHGIIVTPPDGYELDTARYESISTLAGLDAWRELEHVAAALDDEDHRACFRALRDVLVSSVELHEVQHRLDFADGTLERLPAELERRVGPLDAYGLRNINAERALAETSAYLSELAREPALIKLNLSMLAQHVLDPRSWRSPEYFAGLVVFEGLGRELGTLAAEPVRRSATDRVANALGIFLAMDSDELARAAKRLWESLLVHPLVHLRPLR